MPSTESVAANVVAKVAEGLIVVTADVPVRPERAFRALASGEVTQWWVRPGVFDTRDWSGDVRVGGAWESSGIGGGKPYALEGEFLVVDSPRELAHTWHLRGTPIGPTTVTYTLEPHGAGTRITLRHSGFTSPQACENTAIAWQTSFDQLVALLSENGNDT